MRPQVQLPMPFTPMVKKLVIINLVVWVVGVLILQKMVFSSPIIFDLFGLTPHRIINDFWIWQPFSYMFLHSLDIFHVTFNMLLLWWLGAELELRWGARFFLTYYMVCGVGASVIYLVGVTIYYLVSGNPMPMGVPVVGASGAVFGLMLAYGMVFGERVVYFMFIFPMKAKVFVLILGTIELVTLLSSGFGAQVANLCHIGGLISGFFFLYFWTKIRPKMGGGTKGRKKNKLRLVVDNEDADKSPKYWN